MKVKILLIALFSLFFSCDKETNNPRPTAKGKVIDAVSKQPLANVYVALYKTEGDFFNPKYVLVGEQLTDSQGNFNFNRTDAILIRAIKATYFDSKEYDIQDDVYKQTQTIELVPEAFVNVRLLNKEKKWDIIQVYSSSMFSKNLRFNPGALSNFDTTLYGIKIYGINNFMECWVEKFVYTETDSFKVTKTPISLIPHDTIVITINY